MSNKQITRKIKPSARQMQKELARTRLETSLTPAGQALVNCSRITLVRMAENATRMGYSRLVQAISYLETQKQMLDKVEAMRAEMRENDGKNANGKTGF